MSNHHSFAPVSVRRRLGYFTEVADRLSEGKAVPDRSSARRDLLSEFSHPPHLPEGEQAAETAAAVAPNSDA